MNTEAFHSRTKSTDETTDETTGEVTEDKAGDNGKNYCYVCLKPQSKLARHLEMHKTEAEVMEALSYPKGSVKRRRLLEKLLNRGNFQHNVEVLKSGTGKIKLKRTSKQNVFRKELWRHTRRCHFMPERTSGESVRAKGLGLATTAETVFSESISQGVWKLLDPMRQDDVTTVVRNDFGILQLAQTLYNKHGHDTTKYEYIRQKLRELARVLLILRTDSIYTIEEAVKPGNFLKVVKAVKKVSGFDEENQTYAAPSLALKIGHSLQKIADIIHCRALMTENKDLMKSTEAFKSLYTSKWCELVSHTALNTLSEKKFNKPLTLPFTQDVQLLHNHLQQAAKVALDRLKEAASPQMPKMRLKNFTERDTSPLHDDVSLGLTNGNKRHHGRNTAVLLTPDMVESLNLLVNNRMKCGVQDTNVFLFARPQCSSYYRGQDSLRLHAEKCGKSLDDIQIEGLLKKIPIPDPKLSYKNEIQLTDTEDDADGESACASALSKPKEISASTSEACLDGVTGKAGHPDTTRKRRIQWSKAEVAAVLKHFKHHIAKGHLASKSECLQCKNAEEPVLKNRSVQNIRDFVRNRGVTLKRRSLTVSSSES
ncbi:Lipid-A-disaccharide synthase [Labeo rohita]|uniref:Lipid-A-disaccharide synthase n=1 Tax=Labeo rohita TaxID=84645 RepID=A0ABQ8L1D0_LABRO|nr:Lipid-A-disaccharide synthase [Labeo rohita]